MPETRAPSGMATRKETRSLAVGADININRYDKGYSPLTIIVPVYTDNNTLANGYYITAIPTLPGEYTQVGSPWASWNTAPGSVTFYMYNTAR